MPDERYVIDVLVTLKNLSGMALHAINVFLRGKYEALKKNCTSKASLSASKE